MLISGYSSLIRNDIQKYIFFSGRGPYGYHLFPQLLVLDKLSSPLHLLIILLIHDTIYCVLLPVLFSVEQRLVPMWLLLFYQMSAAFCFFDIRFEILNL